MKRLLVGVLVCAAIGGANACQGNGRVGCNDAECRGAQPEITVTIGQETIHSGSGTHAFGSVLLGQASTEVTATIANVGNADLVLGAATLTGAHADQFQVTQPSSPVAAGGSSTFKLVFRPSADGAKVATVRLENSDADENPYTFELSGTGVTNMAAGFPAM
jgi:hypothetical protein